MTKTNWQVKEVQHGTESYDSLTGRTYVWCDVCREWHLKSVA